MKILTLFTGLLISALSLAANPVLEIQTSHGQIEVELFEDKAPISVKNFLSYVDSKFYDETIFHRVISNFMIQGGGFTEKMVQKKTKGQIKNEATNGLKNETGTLAMARTPDPHSASSQFFINVNDNSFLDHKDTTDAGFGYAVFGKVSKGMHVVNRIKAVRTGSRSGHQDVPMDTVMIKTIKRKSEKK